ncbi:MAG: hypothetical protein JNM18_04890 [Planctomycetaceae bacterium]|nr:hypothetical protein [Planctomycetaceae bacterium]
MHKSVPLAKNREEVFETPQLLNSIADQFERMKVAFHAIGVGQGIAKLRGEREAFAFQAALVEEKWSPDDKFEAIRRIRQVITEQHSYNGRPQIGPAAQEERLNRFAARPRPPAEPSAVGPADVPSQTKAGEPLDDHRGSGGDSPFL